MFKTKKRYQWLIIVAVVLLVSFTAGSGQASTLVDQTWLPGDDLFNNPNVAFQTPLPIFGPGYNAALPRVNALKNPILKITMKEIDQQVLPKALGFKPTRVWAYETRNAVTGKLLGPANWPAVTIEARRFIPTVVRYVNDLPQWDPANNDTSNDGFTAGGLVQGLISVDQTLHWANPFGDTGPENCDAELPPGELPPEECFNPYTGPIPTVVHQHGAEVSSKWDGGPEQWFTRDGRTGLDYRTLDSPGPGQAIFSYTNFQEPGTPWIHDHALGATRTNVYSGMAAFWFIRAPLTEPFNLPNGPYEIELGFQDRQFDTNGQLFFPDGSGDDPEESNLNGTPPNPDIHPFWIPEFAGDVMIVNGAPWPVLQVEPRRYRFRLLDGSNARFYNLTFGNNSAGEPKPPVYVIGRDDAYLDKPAKVNSVLFAPGQRVDVIVDFTGLTGNITVTNDAAFPYPFGDLVPGDDGQVGMAQIMQFQVSLGLMGRDNSCNPANGQCGRPFYAKTVRLTNGNGSLAPGVTIQKKRQVILKEAIGFDDEGEETGPLEVLVNNTKWAGLKSPGIDPLQFPDGVTELPQVGSTEVWEIINLTGDAHPMHTHLVQFQILNRETFTEGYPVAWAGAFAGECDAGPDDTNPCPGYGPPNDYNVLNADGALGGNPALSPHLSHDASPPKPEESGWLDTAIVGPGEVMRIVARWAPTSVPVNWAKPGKNLYPFDPTDGPGYVWHCHIVDHEDNEMMRPYKVKNVSQ